MNNEQQQIIDEAYEDYSKAYEKDNSIGLTALVKMVQRGRSLHRKPSRDMFVAMCTHDKTFSAKWGLKIEERELSLEERIDIAIKTGYDSFDLDIAMGNSEDALSNYGIPTKLITVTYKGKTTKLYE